MAAHCSVLRGYSAQWQHRVLNWHCGAGAFLHSHSVARARVQNWYEYHAGGRWGVSSALREHGVRVYRCAGVRAQVARTLVWPDTHALASPCTHTCKHTTAQTYKRTNIHTYKCTNIQTHKHTLVHARHARTHAHTHSARTDALHARITCTQTAMGAANANGNMCRQRKRQWVPPTQTATGAANASGNRTCRFANSSSRSLACSHAVPSQIK